MKITTVRRINQLFFFALFVWFCIVATVGEKFWQIRNWPINWILQLDPLVALGTILSTRKFYGPLHCALGVSHSDDNLRAVFLRLDMSLWRDTSIRRLPGQSGKKGRRENPAKHIPQGPVYKISGSDFLPRYGGVSLAGRHSANRTA